jgi:DNA replication and repair protein RecF
MRLTRLDIRQLRNLADVQVAPGPGVNLLIGPNGAGKTSVLEGLHLLAYGRSFRGRVRDGLVRTGAEALEVYAEWQERPGSATRVGEAGAGGGMEGAVGNVAAGTAGLPHATAVPRERAGVLAVGPARADDEAVQAPTGGARDTEPGPAQAARHHTLPVTAGTTEYAGRDDAAGGASSGRYRRVGLRHTGNRWAGRLDGEDVAQLGDLCAALMVVTFEPGSHALVSGGGEPRRRFVDWGLFHVEQEFLPAWRRYSRALKQRNALLKAGAPQAQLLAWDLELGATGEQVTRHRLAYVARLQDALGPVGARLAPGLGHLGLSFDPGWRRDAMSLEDALALAQDRDRVAGYTSVGPHRADWRVVSDGRAPGEALSRGQAKLVALACLFAQAEDCARARREWPVVALDDLASELDAAHRGRVLDLLADTPAQVFISGTDRGALPEAGVNVFHVEQGRVSPA